MPGVAFDLALFEELNAEYRSKPVQPEPPVEQEQARRRAARRKLRALTTWVDVKDARVVELGCGHGHLTRALVKRGGAAEALGFDVVQRGEWERPHGRKLSFVCGDLASEELVEPASVDAFASFSALEHVERPVRMLAAIERALRPGGRAFLRFNLHRGPLASHRYREVFFGWPHLLFEPEVCAAYYRKHHDRDQTFAWVNRLTAPQYVDVCREVGLRIEHVQRHTREWDVPLYARFVERLGRHPALDLETDFMTLVLEKPRRWAGWQRRGSTAIEPLGYVERQRELDERVAGLRASTS